MEDRTGLKLSESISKHIPAAWHKVWKVVFHRVRCHDWNKPLVLCSALMRVLVWIKASVCISNSSYEHWCVQPVAQWGREMKRTIKLWRQNQTPKPRTTFVLRVLGPNHLNKIVTGFCSKQVNAEGAFSLTHAGLVPFPPSGNKSVDAAFSAAALTAGFCPFFSFMDTVVVL